MGKQQSEQSSPVKEPWYRNKELTAAMEFTKKFIGYLSAKIRDISKQLKEKGLWYWVRVLIVIAIGLWVPSWETWKGFQYVVYQRIHDLKPMPQLAYHTVVVMIGDDEFWKGELGRRKPIKRDYLAKLVAAIDAANPALIAIDFDLSSPVPDGSMVEHPDYEKETKTLLDTIKTVSQNRKIVLAKTLDRDKNKRLVLSSDIYDGFDFGPGSQNVYTGYIALPIDPRKIAVSRGIHDQDKVFIDSFATAIVKASFPHALKALSQSSSMPFGTYLSPNEFSRIPANDILQGKKEALSILGHKIVLIGGVWHELGYKVGLQTDLHPTPVGSMNGVFLHANYVEAILSGNIFPPANEWVALLLECLILVLAAIVFAINFSVRSKWVFAISVCVLLVFASYVSIRNFGIFFDSFVPFLSLGVHSVLDQILEWRREALLKKGGI